MTHEPAVVLLGRSVVLARSTSSPPAGTYEAGPAGIATMSGG